MACMVDRFRKRRAVRHAQTLHKAWRKRCAPPRRKRGQRLTRAGVWAGKPHANRACSIDSEPLRVCSESIATMNRTTTLFLGSLLACAASLSLAQTPAAPGVPALPAVTKPAVAAGTNAVTNAATTAAPAVAAVKDAIKPTAPAAAPAATAPKAAAEPAKTEAAKPVAKGEAKAKRKAKKARKAAALAK